MRPRAVLLPCRSWIMAGLTVILSAALVGTALVGTGLAGAAPASTAHPLPRGDADTAAPLGAFTTFRLGEAGYGGNAIASGPDGNMWFTNNANNSIGRITPSGKVTYFEVPTDPDLPSGPGLFSIAAGPDGNMWFTGFYSNVVGKVTPAGRVTTYPVPIDGALPLGITAGPDGHVWFTLDFANGIGRVTPEGKVRLFSTDGRPIVAGDPSCTMCGYDITAGPLGSLWFTLPGAGLVGRMTTDGAVSTFRVPTATDPSPDNLVPVLGAITAGADGNLWITQPADGKVTRMTPKGAVTDIDLPSAASDPVSITPGPDASLWLAGASVLARIDIPGAKAAATVTKFALPTANSAPESVALGTDGSVWFASIVRPVEPDTTLKLQVGRVGTGYGARVTATVTGTPEHRLICAYASTQAAVVGAVRYQWLRNGKVMRHEDGRRYAVRPGDKGDAISCRASVTFETALYQLAGTSAPVKIRR